MNTIVESHKHGPDPRAVQKKTGEPAMEPSKVSFVCPQCGVPYEADVESRAEQKIQLRIPKLQRPRLCKSCYRQRKQEEAELLASGMNLPVLNGWTEKQISFAFSLRNKFICTNRPMIEKAQYEIKRIDPALVEQEAKKQNISKEGYLAEAFRRQGMLKAYMCLTETNASALIEVLRN